MNRFDRIMDDFKNSLIMCRDYKGIFWASLAQIGITIISTIILTAITIFIALGLFSLDYSGDKTGFIIVIVSISLVLLLLLLIINIIFKTGIISLVKNSFDGIKPSKTLFFEGIKKYFGRIFGTNLVLTLIFIIGFIILLIPLLIYIFTVGVLTAGWGMYVLTVLFDIYFGTWMVIAINDDIGGFSALGKAFRFAKKHFKSLFLLFFITIMLSTVPMNIGGIIAIITGPVIGMVLNIYFYFVIMSFYRRTNSNSVEDY